MNVKCALQGHATDAQIKKDKNGKEYLSLSVQTDGVSAEKVLVTAHSDINKLCDQITPGRQLYIEGNGKIRRWADAGKAYSALWIEASCVEVLFEEQKAPKAAPPPAAQAKAPSWSARPQPQSRTPLHAQDLSSGKLAALAGPAPAKKGKKSGKDEILNDEIPF